MKSLSCGCFLHEVEEILYALGFPLHLAEQLELVLTDYLDANRAFIRIEHFNQLLREYFKTNIVLLTDLSRRGLCIRIPKCNKYTEVHLFRGTLPRFNIYISFYEENYDLMGKVASYLRDYTAIRKVRIDSAHHYAVDILAAICALMVINKTDTIGMAMELNDMHYEGKV